MATQNVKLKGYRRDDADQAIEAGAKAYDAAHEKKAVQEPNIIVVQKKYKDPDYSAKDLAKELKTNTRYLSAVVNSRFGMNYSCLLNEYRVKDALHLLTDKRYADKNVEEISAMVGFANRQSFYAAFYKNVGETPNGYRKKHLENKK